MAFDQTITIIATIIVIVEAVDVADKQIGDLDGAGPVCNDDDGDAFDEAAGDHCDDELGAEAGFVEPFAHGVDGDDEIVSGVGAAGGFDNDVAVGHVVTKHERPGTAAGDELDLLTHAIACNDGGDHDVVDAHVEEGLTHALLFDGGDEAGVDAVQWTRGAGPGVWAVASDVQGTSACAAHAEPTGMHGLTRGKGALDDGVDNVADDSTAHGDIVFNTVANDDGAAAAFVVDAVDRQADEALVFAQGATLLVHGPIPTQLMPVSSCSRFQIGASRLRSSIKREQPTKASARWGLLTATTTARSPGTRSPTR